ncbi:hypothetical protein CcI49_16945 [Frankia sp. CcI49]|uniref:DUF4326 domain-containing protein n=1 Tax=unclassified Frankia TaxID=2632575 RepID=UPI0006CA1499|nr:MULTISPECIES: DUF4326 domain-containing protein [unclassified Frankia]KPM53321.1 hypothetical protein ACG83_21510 [Frankia sp. R43]ONH59634.1 hypothetical protein CcI49_16945 [Frankia sp. CcI49]
MASTPTSTVPARVRLSRASGWRMPDNAVKVDRTTRWGNPFDHRLRGRADAIRRYTAWIGGEGPDEMPAGKRVGTVSRTWVLEHLPELAGHPLACWCPLDEACHADVLTRLAAEGERP